MTIVARIYTTEKIGPNRELTPEGYLLCKGVPVARTGTMIYGPDEIGGASVGPDGVVRAHRSDEDVFDERTIASALGKPITNDHPEGDVNPENWKENSHGVALNIRRGEGAMDDLLMMDLLLTTKEGIEAVQNGKREISLGYDANYEEISEGEYRQFNIVINHIALVEEGRCGSRCAIKDQQIKVEATPVKNKGKINKTGVAKIIDLIMRAHNTKDSDVLGEVISDALQDDELALGNQQGGKEDDLGARTSFTDDDIKAHIDQNAREHEEMRSEIAILKEALAKLSTPAQDDDVTDPKSEEEKMIEDALEEEAPEGTGPEARKAKDSSYLSESFQSTIASAEILVPGIRIPTYDRAANPSQTFKKICGLRRQALDLAYNQANTRSIIDDVLAGKKLDTTNMTCDAVRVLFNSATAVKKASNVAIRSGMASAGEVKHMTLDDVEKMHKDYYKSK